MTPKKPEKDFWSAGEALFGKKVKHEKLFPAIDRTRKGSKQITTDGIFLRFADYTGPADPYRKNNFGFFQGWILAIVEIHHLIKGFSTKKQQLNNYIYALILLWHS